MRTHCYRWSETLRGWAIMTLGPQDPEHQSLTVCLEPVAPQVVS
jgi:hypothetical protein